MARVTFGIAAYVGGAVPERFDAAQPAADGAGLPVLVWIRGGSFTTGSGDTYGAEPMIAHGDGDLIVVTINYRLGTLGYLAASALDEGAGAGNCGFIFPMGAFHASELVSRCSLRDLGWLYGAVMTQQRLAVEMRRYWTRFAIDARPDAAGLEPIPTFDPAAPLVMSFRPGGNRLVDSDVADHRADFWSPMLRVEPGRIALNRVRSCG